MAFCYSDLHIKYSKKTNNKKLTKIVHLTPRYRQDAMSPAAPRLEPPQAGSEGKNNKRVVDEQEQLQDPTCTHNLVVAFVVSLS